MLKLVARSEANKTVGCAVTYRAGRNEPFATCPSSCPLNPNPQLSTSEVDTDYVEALHAAVPRKGRAFTYTHFAPGSMPEPAVGRTTINYSLDTVEEAAAVASTGLPTVVTVAADAVVPNRLNGVPIVRCPAEIRSNIDCINCGNGDPLCARGSRKFVVRFTAHGTHRNRIGTDTPGGCYGIGGNVALHWKHTADPHNRRTVDDEELSPWAKSLPPYTLLRHHVVGDMGVDKAERKIIPIKVAA